jgi:hypothetical protein
MLMLTKYDVLLTCEQVYTQGNSSFGAPLKRSRQVDHTSQVDASCVGLQRKAIPIMAHGR